MSNTLFTELIGDIPASTVDVDTIIVRQRRHRTLRISFAALSAVAVAVAAALTAGLAVIKPVGLENPAGTPSPTPSVHPLQFIPAGVWESRWNWLSTELDRAVKEVAPESHWVLGFFQGAAQSVDGDPPRFYSTDMDLRSTWGLAKGADRGELMVEILYPICSDPAINGTPACRPECPTGYAACREGLTEAGLRYVLRYNLVNGESVRYMADIVLANGVNMRISIGNSVMVSNEEWTYTAHPPISAEDLLAVAEKLSTKFAASPAP
ncbi:hypothetical protein F4553_001260 [Allocatelliglobosispora scoriae]|uniref:Uncharacterized protein n=1 Tax=Allocatelliglobosispora scoriae TaxID=643052 RepID=A0A841BLZ1_9ACTN|nr:hypothetical protein [Allocatelliglobosispora scoriae]MBB5867881.1 hypothetical protein [Allocatelliglobosispora scoriae]